MFATIFRTKQVFQQLSRDSDILYILNEKEREDLREVLIAIYKDIQCVCDKHGLDLMLAYGSVLGAVRHKGFIPWDDDLDLCLFRKDYELFLNVFEQELGDRYVLAAPNSKFRAKCPFCKVLKKGTVMLEITDIASPYFDGIYVDIFPIEALPDKSWMRKLAKLYACMLIYIGTSVSLFQFRNPVYRKFISKSRAGRINYKLRIVIGALFSFRSHSRWCDLFDKFVSSFPDRGLYHTPSGNYDWKGLSKDIFLPVKEEIFEGMGVTLPHKSHIYLKHLYGEYMEIPPVEQRERHYFVKFNANNLEVENSSRC